MDATHLQVNEKPGSLDHSFSLVTVFLLESMLKLLTLNNVNQEMVWRHSCSISITFPQGFRISKNIGHPTSGSGGKKTAKRYLKSKQTHKHTNNKQGPYLYFDTNNENWIRSGNVTGRGLSFRHAEHEKKAKARITNSRFYLCYSTENSARKI